jgi:POT family proton-dependent oligopeptide transporter
MNPGLYAPGDHRRDRAYSIFYVGINIGALIKPRYSHHLLVTLDSFAALGC